MRIVTLNNLRGFKVKVNYELLLQVLGGHFPLNSHFFLCCRFYNRNSREKNAAFQLEYHPVDSDTTCKGPWAARSGCRPGEEFCAYDGIQDKAAVFKCARKVAVGEYCEVSFLYCELQPNVDKCVVVGKWRGDILSQKFCGCNIRFFSPQDDSWCDPRSAECPARHECVTKCNNGRCKNIKTRVWKQKWDCCNPNVAHECDPTTWENERGYRESLECNRHMWQCMPSMGYDGDYDEAYLKELCMEELGVRNL